MAFLLKIRALGYYNKVNFYTEPVLQAFVSHCWQAVDDKTGKRCSVNLPPSRSCMTKSLPWIKYAEYNLQIQPPSLGTGNYKRQANSVQGSVLEEILV